MDLAVFQNRFCCQFVGFHWIQPHVHVHKIDNCKCFSSENCYFDTNFVEKTFKTPTKPFIGVFGLKNRDFLRRPPCSTLPHIYASRPVQNGKTNLQSAFLELYSFHFSLIVMGNN